MNKSKRPYRKHKVKINEDYISVKDWMRQNEKHFIHINGTPTSQQIGSVLVKKGFEKIESDLEVTYTKTN